MMSVIEQFSIPWLSASHPSELTWSKGYYWHSKILILSWSSPWNRQQTSAINVMTLLFHLQFNSGNIPAAPVYGVYISQLIRYSNASAQHSDCSGQKSADDTKATQTRLRGSYGEVIATKILRSLLWTGWPLRNIHFLHGNESFPFYVDGFFRRITDNTLSELDYK